MNNKMYAVIAAVALVFVAGIGAFSSAFARENGGDAFVQKLAQKLGISEAKVQTAVDEIHSERRAEMHQRMEERLTAAVENGELTEAQKEAVLAKVKELESNREAEMESLKNMPPEELRAAMEAKRTELEDWAKANGIDLKYLPVFKIKMVGPGHMKGMGPDKVMFREVPFGDAVPAQPL